MDARIEKLIPSLTIRSTISPTMHNHAGVINARINEGYPKARGSASRVLHGNTPFAGYGYPIGLLLALTYTKPQKTLFAYADESPRIRIR